MYKIYFLLIVFFINFNSSNFIYANTTTKQSKTNQKDPLKELYMKGISQYTEGKYNEAIIAWKGALQQAEISNDTLMQIKLSTNIGACYNSLGFHKTALIYFLKTDKLFENNKEKKENFWINHINIGVCYMSLDQPDLAKEYFDKTIDFNEHVMIIKNINLANWYAEKKDNKAFFEYKIKIDKALEKIPNYKSGWNKIQLDYLTTSKDIPNLKSILKELEPEYFDLGLSLKVSYNDAYFIVYDRLFESIDKIHAYKNEINAENNYYLKKIYYKVLTDYYFKQKNIALYSYYSNLRLSNIEALYKEKNMLYVEDFKKAQEFKELKSKIIEVKQKNQEINSQLKKSQLLFRLSLVLIVMGVIVVFLLVNNYNIKKKINRLSHVKAQNELLRKEVEKIELLETLKLSEEELSNSMINIKKIMLLRKQLNDLTNGNHSFSEKEVIRQIKLTLISFFDNYRELTSLINKKVNISFIIDKLRKEYNTLNEREIEIIEYILYQFTTKEIALLMGKSEKSIQYNRTQIRKKINLDSSVTLEEFFNSMH